MSSYHFTQTFAAASSEVKFPLHRQSSITPTHIWISAPPIITILLRNPVVPPATEKENTLQTPEKQSISAPAKKTNKKITKDKSKERVAKEAKQQWKVKQTIIKHLKI